MPATAFCPRLLSAALAALAGGSASAGVSFEFRWLDPEGVGFRAPGGVGAERRDALERAGAYLSGVLDPAYDARVAFDVAGDETDDGTLASAGAWFGGTAGPGFERMGDVQRKVLFGDEADPDPDAADGSVSWNFEDHAWETGASFGPGEQDFLSTAIHELTHTLGFASEVNRDGFGFDGDAPGTPAAWAPFDEWLVDGDGNPVIGADAALDAAVWLGASTGGEGAAGLAFAGPEAVAANGGEPVYLHSPEQWEPGSSASHLDGGVYHGLGGHPVYLMNAEARSAEGEEVRVLSAVELGILRDLGYRTAGAGTAAALRPVAAPAPAALAGGLALLLGLGAGRRPRVGGLRDPLSPPRRPRSAA